MNTTSQLLKARKVIQQTAEESTQLGAEELLLKLKEECREEILASYTLGENEFLHGSVAVYQDNIHRCTRVRLKYAINGIDFTQNDVLTNVEVILFRDQRVLRRYLVDKIVKSFAEKLYDQINLYSAVFSTEG